MKHTPGIQRAAMRIAAYFHDINGAPDDDIQHVCDVIAEETAVPELLKQLDTILAALENDETVVIEPGSVKGVAIADAVQQANT